MSIDLATLAYAFELPRTDRRRLTMATVAVAGVTAIALRYLRRREIEL